MTIDRQLAALARSANRVRDAEERLQGMRDALWSEAVEARKAGGSVSAIARALGVSRTRVYTLLERHD